MSHIKNTIEINGKIYDAHSGKHIGSTGNIDNVVTKQTHKPTKAIKPSPTRHNKKRDHNPSSVNRKPQKSTTLMRPAVKKPVVKASQKFKQASKTSMKLGRPSQDRQKRAKHVQKSPKITKFNFSSITAPLTEKIVKKSRPIEVKEQPSSHAKPKHANTEHWPVVDQFEKALQSASSHLEEFADEVTSSKRNRKFAYITVSLVAVFVIGFTAYKAMPMIQVKLAANKAGFSPSVPNYSPAGFGLSGPIVSNAGEVVLPFQSRTDNKSYKLIQSPSNWNNQSLLNNFIETAQKQYQTIYSDGKTIYAYDGSNATWVDKGIWYKLEGSANLSADQVAKIANGL